MSIIEQIFAGIENNLKLIRRLLFHRIFISPKLKREIIDQFHLLYYESAMFGQTWRNTTFLGVKIAKCPLDLWVYQEIIFDVRPDVIIETGTLFGGSALYMACLCDLIDHGRVVTIDISEKENRPEHKRIEYVTGSSLSEETIERVKRNIRSDSCVIAVLDSDHSKDHVLNELIVYGDLVTKGSYLIVEDSNLNGHPVRVDHGPGPMEAIDDFMQMQQNYIIDRQREKFMLTFSPKGYLRRVR